MKKTGFQMSAGAVLLLAALYFFSGVSMLAALLLAAAVHEAGHVAALRLCGYRITGFSADAGGAYIGRRGAAGAAKEIVCAAAGPASGILFAYAASALGNIFGSPFFLCAAGASLALSAFNLLPVLPLDGGRILSAAVGDGEIVSAVSFAAAFIVLSAGLALMAKGLGAALFIAGIWLMLAQAGL